MTSAAQALPGITVAWNANREADLAGYHIYYGPQNRAYTNRLTVDKTVTTTRVNDLTLGGIYFLYITAFNAAGIESFPSAELLHQVLGTNLPPTLGPIADVTINEDSGLHAVYVNGISAGGSENQTLNVTTISSNPSLVDAPRVFYRSPDNYAWLVFGPNTNAFGAAAIFVNVDDGVATVTRTFVVNVIPENDLPRITPVPNQILREDTPGTPFFFTVTDRETPPDQLVVTARSSNLRLIPNEYILLGGNGPNREGMIVPQLDQSGTAQITLEVRDLQGASNSVTFTVSVLAVNDDPVLSPIGRQILDEDKTSLPLVFYIFDAETHPDQLGVFALSTNPLLIPDGNMTISGTGNSRSLLFTPASDQYGSCQIEVWVFDGEGSFANTSFDVEVRPINDPPIISTIVNQVLTEDSLSPTLQFTVSDLETSPGDLILTSSSSNPALLENIVFAGAQNQRTFVLHPKLNQSGTASVRLIVTDLNGASNSTTFSVTVTPVNDPPGIDPIPNLTIEESSGPLTVPLLGIHAGAPDEIQALSVSASSSHPDLIPDPVVDYLSPNPTGSLLLAPILSTDGTAVITVTVSDGQLINPITTRTFSVNVRAFNNPPVISSLPDLAVVRIPTPQLVFFNVQDPDTPASNLQVSGYSSDPGLLPNANLIFGGTGTQRTLTIIPVPGKTGLVVVTVVASDGDATVSASFYVLVTSAGV